MNYPQMPPRPPVVTPHGRPIEKFDPERHTGYRDADGQPEMLPGVRRLGKRDSLFRYADGMALIRYDPAIHATCEQDLQDNRARMAIHVARLASEKSAAVP